MEPGLVAVLHQICTTCLQTDWKVEDQYHFLYDFVQRNEIVLAQLDARRMSKDLIIAAASSVLVSMVYGRKTDVSVLPSGDVYLTILGVVLRFWDTTAFTRRADLTHLLFGHIYTLYNRDVVLANSIITYMYALVALLGQDAERPYRDYDPLIEPSLVYLMHVPPHTIDDVASHVLKALETIYKNGRIARARLAFWQNWIRNAMYNCVRYYH